jgi:uncharacterized protein YbaR (Trm112 family)
MHSGLPERLLCPFCLDPGAQLESKPFREEEYLVIDGILRSVSCGEWYPISNGLLELLNRSLIDRDGLQALGTRFASELSALGRRLPGG